MITNPTKLDVLTFATVATPGTPTATFSTIQNQDIKGGAEWFTVHPAGHPAPLFGAISKVRPEISFSTPQIDTVLGALTTWGAAISAKTYQKLSSGVAPYARSATTSYKHTIAQALAFWSNITLPATGEASANVMVRPIYDGTNSPIAFAGSSALPSGVLVATNEFAAGPVSINGTALDGIQSITISSGTNFMSKGDASSVYDTYGDLSVGQCVVTIKTLNRINWSTIILSGLGVTDLTFYAKKWANKSSNSFVANATAEHILFNSATALARPDDTSASGGDLYSDTMSFLVLAPDDTTAPLSVTLLSAIS